MHVLLTNDDGISAPGLQALERAVASLGWRSTTVAPASEQSQCGHRVTTHQPLRVEAVEQHRHAVHGTPADCVRIALFALGIRPDLVISGVNAGGNMGQDLVISGTVAAAREAVYHGIPALAFSHYLKRQLGVDWDRTGNWVSQLLQELHPLQLAPRSFWNVNFPHLPPGQEALPPRRRCHPAHSPLNVSYIKEEHGYIYDAAYAARPQDPGSDVEACFAGDVAVSLVGV